MQKLNNILLVLILVTAAAYFYTYDKEMPPPGQSVCMDPLSYQIGNIDPRFGLSAEEVREALEMASGVWSDAVDRPLAVYSESGEITVNLIYDGRQQLVDGEQRLRDQIESGLIRIDLMQKRYDENRQAFEERAQTYEQKALALRSELDGLNQWVTDKNESGGFTEEEAQVFERRKQETEELQNRIQKERETLDRLAESVNREADRLNQAVAEKNRLIDRYNQDFSGESRFTKATFQRSGNAGTITVSQFMSKSELPLILAHELGHALGLDHVPDSTSVMYPMMGAQELFPIIRLSGEDQKAIRRLCGV